MHSSNHLALCLLTLKRINTSSDCLNKVFIQSFPFFQSSLNSLSMDSSVKVLLSFFLLFSFSTIYGQSFTASLSSTNFSICGDSPTLTITLVNDSGADITQDSVYIRFANAENLYFDNLIPISGPTPAIANADTIVINTPTEIIANGATFSFSIDLIALCGAELTEEPEIEVFFTSNEFVSVPIILDGFAVTFADLSILTPFIESNNNNPNVFAATLGIPDTMKVPVVNAGQGPLTDFLYYVVDPSSTVIADVLVGGMSLAIAGTNGDTVFYQVDAAAIMNATLGGVISGDPLFTENEILTFCEVWIGEDCTDTSPITRAARYGCDGSVLGACQESNAPVTGVSYDLNLPNITAQIWEPLIERPACYADELTTLAIAVTNTGTAPLMDLEVDVRQFSRPGAVLGSSFLATLPDGSTVPGTLTSTQATTGSDGVNGNACAAGPDAFNAADALFSDINLFPGDTVFITYQLDHGCDCRACAIDDVYGSFVTQIQYTDFCGRNVTPPFNTRLDFRQFDARLQGFFEGESFTVGSGCVDYVITSGGATWMSSTDNIRDDYPDAYFESQLSVQCGVDVTSVTNINAAGTVTGSTNILSNVDGGAGGDDMIIIRTTNNVSGVIQICFDVDCAGDKPAGGCPIAAEFSMTNFFVADPSCVASCQANVSCETSYATVFDCPPCGPCDGLTILDLDINRTNFCFLDANNDFIPDGDGTILADATTAKGKRFVEGDTLKAYMLGVVNDGAVDPTPHFWDYAYLELDVMTTNFTILGGDIRVYDASDDVYRECGALSQMANGSNFITDISAPSMSGLACSDFDGFQYAGGDSLILCVYFTPKEPLRNVQSVPVIYNPVWYLSDTEPIGEDIDRCNFLLETLNQIGIRSFEQVQIDSRNFGGCETSPFRIRQDLNYGNLGFDEFCNEIRSPGIPDKYTFVKPPEFQFSNQDFVFRMRQFLGPDTDIVNTDGIPASFFIENGDTLCFQVKDYLLSLNDPRITDKGIDGGFYVEFYPAIQGNCLSEIGTYEACSQFTADVDDVVFCQDKLENDIVCGDFDYTGGPDLIVNSLTPVIELLEPGGCAQVQIRNETNIPAPFAFLNIENVNGGLIVTSVNNLTTGMPITSSPLGIFELGDFPAAATQTYEICANVTDCDPQQLAITAGWDCVQYPTTVDEAICSNPSTVDFITLPGGIDASLIKPTGISQTVQLCDTICYVYRFSSTQLGNIQDLIHRFILPRGQEYVDGSFEIGYPVPFAGQGDTIWTFVQDPDILAATLYSINVTDLNADLMANGVIGSPGAIDNSNIVLVRYNTVTTCDFRSGSRPIFSAWAFNACGDRTRRIITRGPRIFIDGLVPEYDIDITLNNLELNPCNGDKANVDFDLTINADPGVMTSPGDTVSITLPPGIMYVSGTYVDLLNASALAPDEETNNGQTTLTWPITTGLIDGDQIVFELEIMAVDIGQICTEEDILVETYSIMNAMCSAGGDCDIAVLSGSESVVINIVKPDLEIVNSSLNLICDQAGNQTVEYSFKIMNNGDVPQDLDNPFIMELWTDDDANGLLDMMIDNLTTSISLSAQINPGEMVLIEGAQVVTPGALCTILPVINPETACVCEISVGNQTSATIENVFDAEIGICSNEPIDIGPVGKGGFDYEFLSVNGSNLAAVSDPNVSPTTFQFQNTTGADIVWEYAIRTSFANCFSFDTIQVTIFPEQNETVNLSACEGESFTLPGPVEGSNFVWTPITNISPPDSNFPTLDPVPASFVSYMLTYTDANGCNASKVININPIGCAPMTGIGDTVWFDLNADGFQDLGEPGIPGVTVFLYNANNTTPGNHLSATTTDANGFYSFTGLPAGNYVIGFVDPAGFVITTQNAGGAALGTPADSLDNDATPGTGLTGPYFLPNGVFNPTVDAGYIPDCSLDIQIVSVSECIATDEGLIREVELEFSWENAVYTYDFLNGSDTIQLEILGDSFEFVIDQLSGDTTFTYSYLAGSTTDIIAKISLALDPDCTVMDEVMDIVGCVYDLALIKDLPILSPSPRYGDILPFTITVENQGLQPLTNIKINDFLPAGFGFDVALNPMWMESAVDTLMYFITDVMQPGDVVMIPLNLELLMTVGGSEDWLNKSEIFSMEDTLGVDRSMDDIDSTPDADPDNDAGGIVNTGSDDALNGDGSGSLTTTNPNTDEDDEDPEIVRIVDLALIKEIVTPPPYNYGDPITFDITVSNQGAVTAQNIKVNDFIPAGFAWDTANEPEWMLVGSIAMDTLQGPLAPGMDTTVSITLILQMAAPDEYVNIAEIGYFEDTDGNDITGDDVDSQADNDPTNDPGGNPGTASDNVNGGDGTGIAQGTDPLTDEDDNDPAYIAVPLIDIEKSVIGAIPASSGTDGNFDVTFELIITNPGNVKLENLKLQDDLVEQLGSSYVGLVSPPIIVPLTDAMTVPTINPSYNGGVLDTIFNGTEGCFLPDQTITLQFTAELTELNSPSPIINEAVVMGQDTFGTMVMDMDTTTVELPDCFLAVVCPQMMIQVSCPDDVPEIENTVAWFNAIDPLSAIQNSCGQPTIAVIETDNGGSGCVGDTLLITRVITISDPGDGTTVPEMETCTVMYKVVDDEEPTMVCPAGFEAACNLDEYPVYTNLADFIAQGGFVDDNCVIDDLSFAFVSEASDGDTCPETITRTYEVSDDCGNTVMCNQLFTINDETPPVLDCPEITSDCTIDDIPAYMSFAEFMADGNAGTDNCGLDESTFVLIDESSDGNTCPEIVIRKYQIMDMCGNIGTSIQTITLDDEESPVFDMPAPADITISCSDPVPPAATLTATDNCGIDDIVVIDESTATGAGQCSDSEFTIMRIWVAIDGCGNMARDTQLIQVTDDIPPVAMCCPAFDLALDANGQASINLDDMNCGSTDNCTNSEDLVITFSPSVFDENDIGINIVTVTITDLCGNTTTCSVDVNILGAPAIGLAKRATKVDLMDDGCAFVTYEFNIRNYGNVELADLVLTDDLATAFSGCNSFSVDEITSDDFFVNPNYDGTAMSNMLSGVDTLYAGDKGAVLLTVEACGCADGPITNSASIIGNDPNGDPISDESDDGSDPDGDGDGNPNNDDDDTVTSLSTNPIIGIAKRASDVDLLPNGCSEITYELNIQNYGNVQLTGIEVTDDLTTAFAGCNSFRIDEITSDDFVVDPAYAGAAGTNMLTGQDTLSPGDKGAILLTVEACGCGNTTIMNQATAGGTAPDGSTPTDDSDSGSDPDEEGDGPGDNNDVTETDLSQNPVIGLAKRAAKVWLQDDGCALIEYEFNIENTGDVLIDNLVLTDDLATAFMDCAGDVNIKEITSDDFVVNADYAAVFGGANILADGSSQQPGDKGAVLLTVEACGCGNAVIENQAIIAGDAPDGTGVMDESDSGSDPDEDDDGPGDDMDITMTDLSQNAIIGIAKRASDIDLLTNGCSEITYELNIQNYGNVQLTGITVMDDLTTAFAACASFRVDEITSDDFVVDPAYAGAAGTNMLTGQDTLSPGDKGAILLTVEACGCGDATIMNQATAGGTAPDGSTPTDDSDSGSDPDEEGDGPGDNNDVTETDLSQTAIIGIAKRASDVDLLPNGCSEITYELNIQNYGNVQLTGIEVTDDLTTAFAGCNSFRVDEITSDDFVVNAAYDGTAGTNMLSGQDTLGAGDKGAILLTVEACGCGDATITNQAVASGTAPDGSTPTDDSDSGSDPDEEGDGPGDNNDITETQLNEMPLIGLAKRIVNATNNADGSVDIIYEFNIENYGNVAILDLQVTDELNNIFAPCAVDVTSITSDDFIINTGFNGITDYEMLNAGESIEAGDKGAILLEIKVSDCNGELGPYMNSALATGTSPGGTSIEDVSDSGADPDGNGDGDPTNDDDTTDITFEFESFIGLAKNLESIILPGDGTARISIRFIVQNFGNTDLDSIVLIDDLITQFSPCDITDIQIASSPFFVTNPRFDGGILSDTILAGNDNDLDVGESGFVLINYTLRNCGDGQQCFCNQGFITAKDPQNTVVFDDLSQSGLDPDPDGDLDPTNNDECTEIKFGFDPAIAIAKRVSEGPTSDGAGCFDLTYEIRVENFGNQEIANIQIADDLGDVFVNADSWSLIGLESEEFQVNDNYTGIAPNLNLLNGADTLDVATSGNEGVVYLKVNVCPGDFLGPYNNQAFVNGTGLDGTPLNDASQNGSDPDPNDLNGGIDDNEVTPVSFDFAPSIGGAKRVADAVLNADGSFNVIYEINVENFGDVALTDLQVVDDLAAAFPAPCSISNIIVTSDDYSVNPAFDGLANTNLLLGTDIIAVGDKGAILLEIAVDACAGTGPFVNMATVMSTSPTDDPVNDDTVNGSDPDDNGNGDPSDDSSGTPFELTEQAVLGVAKYVKNGPINNGDGSYDISFGIRIENNGNIDIGSLSVIDDLVAAFQGCDYIVTGVSSEEFAVNTSYDGDGDIELLSGNQTIKSWDEGEICINITFGPCSNLGPFANSATAMGTTPAGDDVEDVSQNGSNPDGDGDGDPTNNEDPTGPIEFLEDPVIGLAKRLVSIDMITDDCARITYEFNVENLGDVILSDLSLTDDIDAAFAGCDGGWSIYSITSDDFIINTGYDGSATSDLMGNGNSLSVGDKGAILLTIEACTCGVSMIQNSATIGATSPSGDGIEDVSTDGSDPDPDGDGNPDEMEVTEHTINCTISIVCPVVAEELNVQNDAENCTALVSFPNATVQSNCQGVNEDDIQFMLSQDAADIDGNAFLADTWYFGQPSGLVYNLDTTQITFRIDPAAIPDGSNIIDELCSFAVIVRDEQCPEFITTLPDDITIYDCDIPDVFVVNPVWHLQDNCSDPEDIIVDYSEDTFDVVCANTYTIKRTWMITDEAGNTCIHNHKIFVVDTTGPNIITPADTLIQQCALDELITCRDSIFVTGTQDTTLLLGGEWVLTTLVLKDTVEVCDTIFSPVPLTAGFPTIEDGLCSGAENVTVWFEDIIDVVCKGDKAAIVERVWYAEDECGNRSQASQFIEILDKNPPVLDCKVETTVSIGNEGFIILEPDDVLNDYFDACFTNKDDIEVIIAPNYFDCKDIGEHRVLISANDPCSNRTSYCEVIVHVVDTIAPIINCPSGLVDIAIDPMNCDAAFGDLMNNLQFPDCDVQISTDPPINAGLTPDVTSITVTATDASGNQTVCTIDVNISIMEGIDFSEALTCNNSLNISLNGQCRLVLTADMLLEGDPDICSEILCIEVEDSEGNDHQNFFDETDIDQVFKARVVDCNGTGNSCWSEVRIEEKSIPQIQWPVDTIVLCIEPTDTSYHKIGIPKLLNCETDLSMSYVDRYVEFGPCDDIRARVTRDWTVRDDEGNVLDHSQIINIKPFSNEHLTFPEDITYEDPISCEEVDISFDDITNHRIPETSKLHPDSTGLPGIFGLPLLVDEGLCMFSLGYTDEISIICEGSYEILRTWRVRNICADNVIGENPLEMLQVISVYDTKGPVVDTFEYDVVVSVDPWTCSYSGALPLPDNIEESCAGVSFEAYVTAGGFVEYTGDYDDGDLNVTAIEIPRGTHEVTYVFRDGCRNISLLQYNLIVEDQVAPLAICKSSLTVSLAASDSGEQDRGVAKVFAESIDAGSNDGVCGKVFISTIRLEDYEAGPVMLSNGETLMIDGKIAYQFANGCYADGVHTEEVLDKNDIVTDTLVYEYVLFGEFAKFCCADAGGLHDVVLRIVDEQGLEAYCNTVINVVDETSPILTCDPITINCEDDLEPFENQVAVYNPICVGEAQDLSYLDSGDGNAICGEGTFIRTWYLDRNLNETLDADEASCRQEITIVTSKAFDPFTIKWPKHYDDANYNGINIECDEDGEVSIVDKENINMGGSFDCTSGTISDTPVWCETACGLIAYSVEEDTVSVSDACLKIIRRHTIIDWCIWEPNSSNTDDDNDNGTDSFIAVEDWAQGTCASCPNYGPAISDSVYFKYDTFDADGYYTFDQVIKVTDSTNPVIQVADQVTVDLLNDTESKNDDNPCANSSIVTATASDLCGGSQLTGAFIDWEITVTDANGNVVTDETGQDIQYASGMEVSIDTRIGNQNSEYLISWKAIDGCGNQTVANTIVTFVDSKSPTPICISGVSTGISLEEGTVSVWAKDFDNGSFDNCTRPSDLDFSIVLEGESPIQPDSTGFNDQFSIVLSCDTNTSLFSLDVWIWDEDRNGDYCTVQLLISDNCEPVDSLTAGISGLIFTETGKNLGGVEVTLNSGLPEYPRIMTTENDGGYAFDNNPIGLNYSLNSFKDDVYINGVSSLDLIFIRRHILALDALDSPYKIIAADANNSQSISAADITQLQLLVLGKLDVLPSSDAWRFVEADYEFFSEQNPWPFTETIDLIGLRTEEVDQNFIAVKVGDVNSNVDIPGYIRNETRDRHESLYTADKSIHAGEEIQVEIGLDKDMDIAGFQFTLEHKGLELTAVHSDVIEITEQNYGQFANRSTFSWHSESCMKLSENILTLNFIALDDVRLSEVLQLNSEITRAEIYVGDSFEERHLDLQFEAVESELSLFQNTPNPFINTTVIGFSLPRAGELRFTISDVTGKQIYQTVKEYDSGNHEFVIDKKGLHGAGIYYYQIEYGDKLLSKKMILIE